MNIKKILVGSAAALAVGGLGATTIEAATPEPAAAIIRDVKNVGKQDVKVCFGFNGHAGCDTLHPGDWSELSFVGSVWVPAGKKLYFNGVRMNVVSNKGHWYNAYLFRAVVGVKLTG